MVKKAFFAAVLMNCFLSVSTRAQVPDVSILTEKAPHTFRAVFITTRGPFTIEAYREWSPKGVDRLFQLIKSGFYNNTSLFRVEPDFVVQFGISDTRAVNRFWDRRKLDDEPAKHKNEKGVMAFARGGSNDRATQLFINTANNPLLDTIVRLGRRGYTPVARVIQGMDVVARFYGKYRRSTLAIQDSVYKYGNSYLEKYYPGLDRILSARLVP